jgi:hypothetical protein
MGLRVDVLSSLIYPQILASKKTGQPAVEKNVGFSARENG